MHFRAATNADQRAIRRLVFEVLAEYGLSTHCPEVDRDLDDLQASYFRAGGYFQVLEDDDGTIVGTTGIMPIDRKRCELRKMYLHTSRRGRGLGRQLLDRAISWAREAGFQTMELETTDVLTEANGLYRRYGFLPIDRASVSQCGRVYALDLRQDGSARSASTPEIS